MTSQSNVTIAHCKIQLQNSFEGFTKKLELTVKFLDIEYAKDVITHPKEVGVYLKSMEGTTGLLIFNIQNHGALLNLKKTPRKAKQYVVGNPLVAIQMTVHDIRASLYAPLRMIVYEVENQKACVQYDLPSSLFGQFGNDAVLSVAKDLDEKLSNVISMCDN